MASIIYNILLVYLQEEEACHRGAGGEQSSQLMTFADFFLQFTGFFWLKVQ